ncbi:MAG: S41 family peptidase [bacterium]
MSDKPLKNRDWLSLKGVVGISLALGITLWLITRVLTAGGGLLSEVKEIAQVMSLIRQVYVEEPDLEKLTEGAIEGMLRRLDPHSVYLPSSEQKAFSERDIGQFEGIGISFVIINDLVTVIAPIPGTPAEKMGLRAGDRIVEIDGVSAIGINNEEVFRRLRGPRGTTVSLKVIREGLQEPLDFTLVRDTIPIHSVWANFMLDDSTGYILLNQFTATTSAELHQALTEMESRGMKRLILDLRNNHGGRLQEAVELLDMFIPAGYPLVSHRGRSGSNNKTYYSSHLPTHPLFDLIILVNEGSASAAEIVAGAIQDLDRGLVVGKPTFGKGLVQVPFPMKNGGVIRLSTAYWYAPSGRTVQKPFYQGREDYYALSSRSKIDTTNLQVYKTLTGREVKGFSGIIPDSVVEEWTISSTTAQLIANQFLFSYAQELARHYLPGQHSFEAFLRDFQITDEDLNELWRRAQEKKIPGTSEAFRKDSAYVKTLLKAEMAQIIWNGRDFYYRVITTEDPIVKAGLNLFPLAKEISAYWHKRNRG